MGILKHLLPALLLAAVLIFCVRCSSTELIESPKTAYVPENAVVGEPKVIWTSRTLTEKFDYLGLIKSRSWSYDGALARLVEGGKQLKADAIIDVHYEPVGFLSTMEAFAVKFKSEK